MVGLAEFNEGKGRKGWDKVKDISITWGRGERGDKEGRVVVGLAEFNEGKGWDKVKDISITWERGGHRAGFW